MRTPQQGHSQRKESETTAWSSSAILNLLRSRGLAPKRSLGQNFLIDESHLARIAGAADLNPDDIVLEVGPGPGVLTRYLAGRAGRVVAVELDERLIPVMQQVLAEFSNVHVVHGDILNFEPGDLISQIAPAGAAYKVVANLPYYITSAVLRHLLEAAHPPQVLVLTVQKEVAQRMAASPPDMSLLAVSAQFYASVHVVGRIPAGAFYPAPKVNSAVVRLDRHPQPAVPDVDPAWFFAVVRAGFGQRRKQLRNSLAAGLERPPTTVEAALALAGIDPRRRAETLTLTEWGELARALTLPDQ